MYPYYLFNLPLATDDETVANRYYRLLQLYPPDRDPERFAIVRHCYERLKDRNQRLRTFLFHFDPTGRAFLDEPLFHRAFDDVVRPRLSPAQLAATLNELASADDTKDPSRT
jgi:curved DNA-binding protein CbpA